MKKGIVAIALALSLTLTACSSRGGSQETGKAGNKDLVVIKSSDIFTMDSSKATDEVSFETLGATNEGLYRINKDGVEELAGASDVKESEDKKTYTFTIRDSKWSNGEPVTANDYVFAWRRLADPKTASEYAFILETAGIENAASVTSGKKPLTELGVKALDDKTLEVKLDRPISYFKKIMSFGSFYPLNQKFVEQQADQYAKDPEHLLANGPFRMTDWQIGNSFKVVKNDKYWNAANTKLDSITWKVAKDSQSAALAFDTGEADFVRLTGEIIDNYRDRKELKQELGGYLWFVVPNLEVPELQNKNLTLAIANGIDRAKLASDILKDGAQGANYFIPEKLAFDEKGEDFRLKNGKNFFNEGPEKAKEYAKKAFAELGKDNLTLELLYEDTEESKKVAEFIKIELEKNVPGLSIALKSQPKKSRINLQIKGDFQLALHRWGPDYQDPTTYLDLFLHDSAHNYGHYNVAKYDELLALASSGKQSDADRWSTLMEAERLLLKDGQGPIPIYQVGNSTLWAKRVKGVNYHSVGVSYDYNDADITN